MKNIRNRAKELFPSVLMTLLSIIQALALEFLWNQIQERSDLWSLDWQALLSWLQILAAMLGVLQVWVFYTSVVMRFSWTPAVRDLVLPFGIGLLEFALIDLTGSAYLPWWLVTLAAVYAVSIWVSHDIFVRARRDPDNEEFFAVVEPATLADLIGPAATVVLLVIFAIAVNAFRDAQWLSLAAIGFAVLSLLYRVAMGRRYWNMSMGIGG